MRCCVRGSNSTRSALEMQSLSRGRAHQGADMRRDRFLQALKIITALEHRNNSASRGAIGEIHQLSRRPSEVLGLEIDRSQRVAMMRIESGRDDDQFGAELA